jgi:hypothetical protein
MAAASTEVMPRPRPIGDRRPLVFRRRHRDDDVCAYFLDHPKWMFKLLHMDDEAEVFLLSRNHFLDTIP